MYSLAVERSRWLGELAQAVELAQQLLWELGPAIGIDSGILDLYARLEVVREEVDAMRRARGAIGRDRSEKSVNRLTA